MEKQQAKKQLREIYDALGGVNNFTSNRNEIKCMLGAIIIALDPDTEDKERIPDLIQRLYLLINTEILSMVKHLYPLPDGASFEDIWSVIEEYNLDTKISSFLDIDTICNVSRPELDNVDIFSMLDNVFNYTPCRSIGEDLGKLLDSVTDCLYLIIKSCS